MNTLETRSLYKENWVYVGIHYFSYFAQVRTDPLSLFYRASAMYARNKYSEIPILRPPKIKRFGKLKTLFAKFKLSVSSFFTPSVHLIRDHLWDCPKVVFKTTFEQSQRWSLNRNFTV